MIVDKLRPCARSLPWLGVCAVLLYLGSPSLTQPPRAADKPAPDVEKGPLPSSYDQVSKVLLGEESFQAMKASDEKGKADVEARQKKLLEERYDVERAMRRGSPRVLLRLRGCDCRKT